MSLKEEKTEIDELQNGNDMFNLFFDNNYIKQELDLPSGRKMSFLGLKGAMTDPDLTGQILWPGCSLLMHWLDKNIEQFDNQRVIEVGAGTAICSIFVAKYGHPKVVIATDGSLPVVDLMKDNMDLHPDAKNVSCLHLKWEDNSDECNQLTKDGMFDCVIGSEIAYNENCVEGLVDTANSLLKEGGKFIVGHIDRYAQTTKAFLNKLQKSGFQKIDESKWSDLMDYKMELIVGSVLTFQKLPIK